MVQRFREPTKKLTWEVASKPPKKRGVKRFAQIETKTPSNRQADPTSSRTIERRRKHANLLLSADRPKPHKAPGDDRKGSERVQGLMLG
jgi:hypothetical protein